ncbi:DEAD/DEAH box helicase [Pseudomonas sp. EA_35y_Pfl2_R111]|uniref:DEAD/DEAH box helicase n=1 Tax=Pseudomonas sp. EA_35y_Pfl2_R111 TaxID=3088689 RepID=UPI0030D8332E
MSEASADQVRQRIGFYRSCYLADSRDLDLDNLGKLPADRWAWLEGGEELASGGLPLLPLSSELGAALDAQQRLYQRELQLVYGVLPVCGRLTLADAPTVNLCGPLVYYEARLQPAADGQSYFLAIDLQLPQANWRLLRSLVEAGRPLDDFPLPGAAIDTLALGELLAWVENATQVASVEMAAGFPALAPAADLSKAQRRQSLSLQAGAAVALVPRGTGSRGIAHELQALQSAEQLSPPLRQLLGDASALQETTLPSTPQALPALLSASQCQVLGNAARFELSQISGPPGTGKSYTLAALALDRYLQGESVLLVSRSEQAVRVMADKLRNDFGLEDAVLEGDGQSMLKTLRERLARLLQGELAVPEAGAEKRLYQELQQLLKQEQSLAGRFRRRGARAERWSHLLLRAERGSLPFWRRWLQLPLARYRVRNSARPWGLLDELRECQQRRERLSREYINVRRRSRLQRLLSRDRDTLVRYNQAIRARNSQRQLALFEDIDPQRLLAAFPIWVVSLDELHRLLPLRAGLFDVLVMDEATQCDIASALPALQRCRRAVVAGDARQLRHISFLSRARETLLLERAGLPAEDRDAWSYRDNSVLDLVSLRLSRQEAVIFLDEHFRSRPALIRFSNEHFYEQRLKVMKERPGQEACDSLQLERLAGSRGRNGVNDVEVERVLELVREHVMRYASSALKPSIGVLSPFRDQVEAIRQRIGADMSLEQLRDFRLLVATPYGFQGEERDLMIISFALHDARSQAANYLNRADMFNVAITRARERQVLLFSGNERDLAAGHLLRRYLERSEQVWQQLDARSPVLDAFTQAVCQALQEQGVRTWVGHPLAGQRLDIYCQRGERCLAIDLIGYPGESEAFLELERYLVLARAGLEAVPLSYALWQLEPQAALTALLQRL